MFCIGRRDGFITLAKQDDILIARIQYDARSEDIEAIFRMARDMGWLNPDNGLLIDVRSFIGSVDWGIIRDMRKLAPWVDGPGMACAYLLHSVQLAWLVEIVTAFYPQVRHRIFREEEEAMAWLHTRERRAAVADDIRSGYGT